MIDMTSDDHLVSQPIGSHSTRPLSLPSDTCSGTPSQSEITQGESYRHPTTIDMLPDNALLEIFVSYRNNNSQTYLIVWKWHLLIHVCRRWRQIIFESPRRLDLYILCTFGTPVRKHLGIWPNFPIALDYDFSSSGSSLVYDEDNVIAALEHPSRVCYLRLVSSLWSEKMATAMQKPFPALRNLIILPSTFVLELSLPDGFLGGSAPCLQEITLQNIYFPALPMLLSSASDLVRLHLHDIPPTGDISSKAMATCLAALPRLKAFRFSFQASIFFSDLNHPSPITRAVLPTLEYFDFKGRCEYLEDLVARIECPRLNEIEISYFNRDSFQVVQLSEFFDRSLGPERSPFRHAAVRFFDVRYLEQGGVTVETYRPANYPGSDWQAARAIISCTVSHAMWRMSHVSQVLRQFSPILSSAVLLRFSTKFQERFLLQADDLEWIHLLRQFSIVQVLSFNGHFASCFARRLESITGEMVAEALSSLDLIYLEGQPTSSIQKFVDVRQLSGRPVTVVDTETEFDERLNAYVGK